MAGTSLLALIDDIATLLDDVAILSKVAVKKTAGVLGDDLALNAEQVSGVRAERELPVIWAVAKGSFKNKLILVPAALAISALIPWLIIPLLMVGGLYLCYEGFEKILHYFSANSHENKEKHAKEIVALADSSIDLVEFEKVKIKGAIRTDFILSAEIIVIVLGTVKDVSFGFQVAVVSAVAILITVVVYGLVAAIVKLDDAGFYLIKDQGKQFYSHFKRALGKGLLAFAPFLMKSLSVIGTIAMFVVGGGILLHGIPSAPLVIQQLQEVVQSLPVIGNIISTVMPFFLSIVVGVGSGAIALLIVFNIQRFLKPAKLSHK